ncbi:MAG: DUF4038 domain-containing protein [Acetobacteraceae bacterium]|nr:DUF4038 domain-containing protein [Acetobacteraceae bacterium]
MKKSSLTVWCVLLLVAACASVTHGSLVWAQAVPLAATSVSLSVSPSGRYLQLSTGTPFLIVGDNGSALFQNLPLTGTSSGQSNANATFYLSTRASQGVNAVWATAICSNFSGCASNASQTYDGLVPFSATISSCGTKTPNCYDMSTAGQGSTSNYWVRMDAMINLAASYGIVVFFNPVDTGNCNAHNDNPLWPMLTTNRSISKSGATNTYDFGEFLGNRYKSFPKIVWLHGDDYSCNGQGGGRPAADDLPVLDIMNGIAAAGDTHPQTIELWSLPPSSSFDNASFVPPTGQVNVNGVYTYNPNYVETLHAWNQAKAPVVMLETNYEWDNNLEYEPNDPNCGYSSHSSQCMYEYTIRKQFYQATLSGANAGYITGEYPISTAGFCLLPSTCTAGTGWINYLNSTGMTNFGYWASLFLNNGIPWWELTPDQGNTFVTGGRGMAFSSSGSCTANSHAKCITPDNYVTAASYSTSSASGLLVYIPCYATSSKYGCAGTGGVTVAMNQLGTSPTARWYDPTSKAFTTICSPSGTACSTGSQTFTPTGANGAGDPDWVLVITAAPG